ncbi:MAG: ribose 5-phosphate isomerase B [Bdellovibrio sp.]|nr:MAG: ribose 5-phosphate isomerase B [Bdellovibrio sp.]
MSAPLYIASDHAGFALKTFLINHVNYEWEDLGTHSEERVDYPDYADLVAQKVSKAPETTKGVLICGSGQGMAIRANRWPFVRAALCYNEEVAKLARAHNNANILCLGGRLLKPEEAVNILDTFLQTPFEGGRHQRRVEKLSAPINSKE